jgi:hypothetical protein
VNIRTAFIKVSPPGQKPKIREVSRDAGSAASRQHYRLTEMQQAIRVAQHN